jgi:TolA-binding protein
MSPKPTTSAAILAVLFFCPCLATRSVAQAPPPAAPTEVVGPATWNRLFNEAEAAFTAKNYETAIAKIQELLKALGTNKNAPLELLYFNIGLANLLSDKNAEAEAAFLDCIKRFPAGEYTSRSFLGLGRACMMQTEPEKKQRAVDALRTAAKDSKYRSEAGLWLGQVLMDLGKHEDALVVFRSLMGSDVRTPQQTTAAVAVIGLLADLGKLEDLSAYLENLSHQSGVRDAIAWFANQVVVRGDELVGSQAYEPALAIYRSVPPRSQILEIQASALEGMRKDQKILELRVKSEEGKALNQRSSASQLLNSLKPAVEQAEMALKAIEEKADLDAALLMRRGRCLFYMDRYEEALVCFRTIRSKFPTATDAEKAGYAEIVILNKLKNISEIKDKCDQFLRKYPESDNAEQVATLAGEVLVQAGDWKEVGLFYRGLEAKFPKSDSLDRFVFFQGLAHFQDANFAESTPMFDRFLKNFPNSPLAENALYYVAMSNFLSNKYKETLASCAEYLKKFPDGRYAGDMRYRLSFIDFNDKEVDQSDKIIRDLSGFLAEHPDDAANGSMLCLLADTYKKKNTKTDEEATATEDKAIEAYIKAVWTDSPDDVIQYALDSATNMLKARKDWGAVGDLHGAFLKRKPDSQLALMSAVEVAKNKAREGKSREASEMLATALKARIANPASEQVEFLIDELVKTLVPKKKAKDINADEIDKELVGIIEKTIGDRPTPTTAARIYYARARLAQLLKRSDRADLYLKGIATSNAKDPSVLSPQLLVVSGDILLKNGDLDGAEAMFKRLADRYAESMYSDAGPVGLGYIALARKKPDEALKIFDNALTNIPGMSRFKEATLGKLQALVELDKLEPAEKLAAEVISDKTFRGETAGKANLFLGDIYLKQAAKSATVSPSVSQDLLKKAHGTFIRVFLTYKGFPDVAAQGIWQASETAKQLGDEALRQQNLKDLLAEPKLQNTAPFKKAGGLVN